MTEDFLHYIWRCGLYYPLSLKTRDGFAIKVLSRGEINSNSGPDFFNAMIRIDDTVFAGNVEIHVNSSDWYRHGHHTDRAYDNVILQLVLNRDAVVKRTNGEVIPTAEIRFDKRLHNNYSQLLGNEFWIPCQPFISGADAFLVREWLYMLSIQRLEQKSLILRDIFHKSRNCWEETFYIQLARNFGFRLNGAVFEMLARSLPYKLLLRHRENLFQLEAMLFGQAGMLVNGMGMPASWKKMSDHDGSDEYFRALKKEYSFLKIKYRLKPIEKHLWRFLRLRPANFPTIRLAQFAAFLHEKTSLFSTVLDCSDLKSLFDIFMVSASEYWNNHFLFNRPSAGCPKSLGIFAIRSLIINTAVPVLYFYGKQRQLEDYSERAIDFLMELPPESNSIITKWNILGIKATNAFQSQALLQLKNELCSYRRCLDCRIGTQIVNMH